MTIITRSYPTVWISFFNGIYDCNVAEYSFSFVRNLPTKETLIEAIKEYAKIVGMLEIRMNFLLEIANSITYPIKVQVIRKDDKDITISITDHYVFEICYESGSKYPPWCSQR